MFEIGNEHFSVTLFGYTVYVQELQVVLIKFGSNHNYPFRLALGSRQSRTLQSAACVCGVRTRMPQCTQCKDWPLRISNYAAPTRSYRKTKFETPSRLRCPPCEATTQLFSQASYSAVRSAIAQQRLCAERVPPPAYFFFGLSRDPR